jgi:hypothetical protein
MIINKLFLITVFAMLSFPAMASEVVIVGEVNDTYQIVSNGQIYEVDANDGIGIDLVTNYMAQKVKVTGTVRKEEDLKIITVKSFQTVEE